MLRANRRWAVCWAALKAPARSDAVESFFVEESRFLGVGNFNFQYPESHENKSPIGGLIKELSNTRAFKRLQDIRFLGALDYYLIPNPNGLPHNSRFTRAQHSFGVASLAQAYLAESEHSLHARLVCVGAALLHDIGHTPFSHTLEPVFQEAFGLDHHKVSEAIIRGDDKEFEDIPIALRNFGVDPEEIIDVLNGNDEVFDSYFSGPINFDTIEGILRSRKYVRLDSLGLDPMRVLMSSKARESDQDRVAVDNFWYAKHQMYNLVIRSAYGAMLDRMFQEIVRSDLGILTPNDFYLTDSQAFRKFSFLRKALNASCFNDLRKDLIGDSIDITARSFFVDEAVSFYDRHDRARYKQYKEAKKLTLPDLAAT